MLDVIVIGAGPAGIQAGYFLKKKGISYEIIERNECAGSFFRTFPRHKKLISINKRYTGSTNREFNLRHDWNSLLSDDGPLFTNFDEALFPSSESLLDYLKAFVDYAGIPISYNSEVNLIEKKGAIFTIELTNGRNLKAKSIIIATGFTKANIPMIKGIEHAEEYSFCSIDKADYINKRVLIIGKGNSAFETADHIADSAAVIHLSSPNSIKMAWSTHYVGNLRAVNNNILDMYQLKSQHAIIDADIESIKKLDKGYQVVFGYKHAEGERETINYDIVLSCAGFKVGIDLFGDSCTPVLSNNGKYPALTNAFESQNIPGMYFAGTLTHSLDYRKATSGFIHGFRYNIKSLADILDKQLHNNDISSHAVEPSAVSLAKNIINRVNVVSSLWQQPGFLAEFYQIQEDSIQHFDALPLDYGVKNYFIKERVVSLTFEYGHNIEGDIFSQARIARDNVGHSSQSQFLHPVLRHFNNGELVQEFHVIEDLEAHWTENEHLEHIATFLKSVVNKNVIMVLTDE
ncbi:NAD(P)-binding domain-containing protein [Rheinheimera baltica]|uniref:NAD(P)-binding domain-containing protein n=1 Tax=Rheinheimera baltica TaxID=67576 RepID=A0ABT9I4D0_9GAMM|nr:NAD(P)-binding domain-containing protein [Rheinheimera baltica]MDP5138239.1 NAD(P)-binding domain-containing protein [Rheinheimera baltica]